MSRRTPVVIGRYLACAVGLALVVPVNATTAALCMLLVVLAAAIRWGLAESIFTSIAGMLSFNFFFLPPIGTFTIADPVATRSLRVPARPPFLRGSGLHASGLHLIVITGPTPDGNSPTIAATG